jgi:hypothetical protein
MSPTSAARCAATALAAMLLLAPASAPAAGPIGQAALERLFPGTFAVSVRGIGATFVASGNGALKGATIVGTDSGSWIVRSGKLCIMLHDWFNGRTRCSTVVREGDWYRADAIRFRKI